MSSIKLVLMVLLQIAAIAYCQKEEGNTCTVDSAPGICKLLPECQPVLNDLRAGKTPASVCGFKKYVPIVCCTDNPPQQNSVSLLPGPTEPPVTEMIVSDSGDNHRTVGTIARAKCAEYSGSVYQLAHPMTLSPSVKPTNVSVCAIRQNMLSSGGIPASPMEFPHMAAIGFNNSDGEIVWVCGGSLVSDRFVLTVAHCLFSYDSRSAVKIRVGDLNLGDMNDGAKPQERDIIARIRHTQYNMNSGYNDIALLKVDEPFVFDAFVRPACLPYSSPDVLIPQDKVVATGWGRINFGDDTNSPDLLKATLDLVDYDSCNMTYTSGGLSRKLSKGIVPESQICVKQNERNPCQSGSGSPIQIINQDYECMYTVVGAASFGLACRNTHPEVYTRIQHYLKWLEDTIWSEGI